MRTISRTTAFKRDYRREKRGRHRDVLDNELLSALRLLVAD
jgi:mRNA interferase YafQ